MRRLSQSLKCSDVACGLLQTNTFHLNFYKPNAICASVLKRGELAAVSSAGYFLTKIFHPNVSKPGEICVNVLKRDWKPDMGLRHVLVIVRCLLIEPFPGAFKSPSYGAASLACIICLQVYLLLSTLSQTQVPGMCSSWSAACLQSPPQVHLGSSQWSSNCSFCEVQLPLHLPTMSQTWASGMRLS